MVRRRSSFGWVAMAASASLLVAACSGGSDTETETDAETNTDTDVATDVVDETGGAGPATETTAFVSEDDAGTTVTTVDDGFDPEVVDDGLVPDVVDEVVLDDDVIIATEDGQIPTTTAEPAPGPEDERSPAVDTTVPGAVPAPAPAPAPAEVTRVVSLSPTHTATLSALGAGALIVGIDNDSSIPDGAADLQVDDLLIDALDIDAVVALDPDLVVIGDDPFDRAPVLLAEAGIAVYDGSPPRDLLGIQEQILDLAAAVGRQGEGERLVAEMRDDLAEIFAALPDTDAMTYFHEIDPLLTTWAPGDLLDSLYNEIGLSSIVPPSDLGFVVLDEQALFAADPTVIALADVDCCQVTAARAAARPGWSQLSAVQNGAIVEFGDEDVGRFGLNVVDFYRALAGAIVAAS